MYIKDFKLIQTPDNNNKPTLNQALRWILRLILQCLKHFDRNLEIPGMQTLMRTH